MPRKQTLKRPNGADWFLKEWMADLQLSQAFIVSKTDWSPSTVNDIYHGRTEYYRGLINTLADLFNIKPFELLMHPDEARAMRSLHESALHIAAETRLPFRAREDDRDAA